MNPLCIMISFALINCVVAELDEYIKQVLITNDHIKLANKHMPKIIIKLLLENFSPEILAFMLAVPECDSLHLKPGERLEYQTTMQSVISTETGIDAPTFNEEKLTSLLEERRCRTSEGLNNRIIRASGHSNDNYLTYLGSERRHITLEAVKCLIRKWENDPFFLDLNKMCRLIGVFRSIKYPHACVYVADITKEINTNIYNCLIINVIGDTKLYTIIGGELWEVAIDGNHVPIQPFSYELLQD